MSLLRSSTILGIGLGLSFSLHSTSPFRALPIQCQYSAPNSRADSQISPDSTWAIPPDGSRARKQGTTRTGFLTASTMRQVSLGSVLGLVVGVGLRAFSRALVVLFGIGIVVVEWAAAKGYNLVPWNRMQKYVKNYDLQKAVSRNRPLKISFGATMALAAFAQF
ncbi:hypothetical protein P175DRAFT_0558019 [Aspergillus ochraceoroseus IBT 24754]|uniref:FUN14 family protein n=3 Tax=Aspergillus subgen. Nidulantes TaxID=2720870 RepID=A0A0F8WY77_9EURO|nr:uncharacterized protein P175DRAFT_0558019 [Aspergillus ochraceoroseus IBT 24754]KKK22490.1 hypothetical protein ARAM_000607 [Aspergillus rambellii]KKK22813.1 hypothetical protein AOCH_005776 [Aspergillus ochraceoroseus]PTU19810.1 hypothetical protein P175DRAFT_0558019 [Aspergillus ochraceoroseus IBT 24754]